MAASILLAAIGLSAAPAPIIIAHRGASGHRPEHTLEEIKTLRATERLEFRSHEFDGRFQIPTLAEVIDLAERSSRSIGRTIAIYPETKHPTYFRGLGLPIEEPLLAALQARGWTRSDSLVFIQSFEASSLMRMRPRTAARLVMLVSAPEAVTPPGSPASARSPTASASRSD